MREPDAVFADQRQADLYDLLDNDRSDLDAYVAIAQEIEAAEVVDLGCGTGSLSVRLAGLGIAVVGVDPAEASLNVARRKPGAEGVTWIHGDAIRLGDRGPTADFVVMTGNVAQVFITDQDWSDTLLAARECLRPGGWLVFETRRPAARDWENWDIAPSPVTLPDGREAVVVRAVTAVALPLITFEGSITIGGDVLGSTSTLRFRERHEIDRDLAEHGFTVIDVRDAPDRPGKEFVFLAQKQADDAAEATEHAGRAVEVNAEFGPVAIDGEVVTRPAGAAGATGTPTKASPPRLVCSAPSTTPDTRTRGGRDRLGASPPEAVHLRPARSARHRAPESSRRRFIACTQVSGEVQLWW